MDRPICPKCNKNLCEIMSHSKGFRKQCWACRMGKGEARIKYNLKKKQRNSEIKKQVIDYYGGKCKCCNENNIGFLTIDHINNDGGKHREMIGNGTAFYYWIIKNNYPKDLQILCFNCNCGRNVNGGICPHNILNAPVS